MFSDIQNEVDIFLLGITGDRVLAVVGAIGAIMGSILSLYFTWRALRIATGQDQYPIMDNLHKIIYMMCVIGFAFNADGWLDWSNSVAYEIKEVVTGGSGAIADLDHNITNFKSMFEVVLAPISSWYRWFFEILGWIGFFVGFCVFLFLKLCAEIYFRLHIVFMPLAILALAFDVTKGMFSNWTKGIVGSLILMLITSILSNLSTGLIESIINSAVDEQMPSPIIIIAYIWIGSAFVLYMAKDLKQIAREMAQVSVSAVTNKIKNG